MAKPEVSGPVGLPPIVVERQHTHPHGSHHGLKTRPHVQLPAQVRRVVPHGVGAQPHRGRNVRNVPADRRQLVLPACCLK